MKKKVNILGIKFDCLSLAAACGKIEAMIEKGGCYQVGTVNPEYVVRVQDNKQLARAIDRMSLVVPDGMGIIWAQEIIKIKRKIIKKIKQILQIDIDDRHTQFTRLKRIRGGDLVEVLTELCARKGYKIGLVGGERGVAQKALRVLQKKYPGLKGFADNGPKPRGHLAKETSFAPGSGSASWRTGAFLGGIGELIIKENPQILLTALSFKGPIWIDQLLSKLKKKKISLVALEVGGVFNYLTGKSRVPPKIVKETGLEWLWRLVTEPWRWKRQLKLIKFLWLVARYN